MGDLVELDVAHDSSSVTAETNSSGQSVAQRNNRDREREKERERCTNVKTTNRTNKLVVKNAQKHIY